MWNEYKYSLISGPDAPLFVGFNAHTHSTDLGNLRLQLRVIQNRSGNKNIIQSALIEPYSAWEKKVYSANTAYVEL